ncbi:FMN-linked oxidoreductase [Lophiostoma macrostomum CBS 122681]|uniref:FMN-linked oxidoreductase n=1 Tax=Lophiostoma macrostomum CBS 122681 TaxID=1314788 RepID=A0A6A6TSQ1_9PLEO|nr:FMN-linked oxidoreductase [Lophiostoma macrostomum CBS 122681]
MAPKRYQSAPADPAPLGQPIHFPFSKRTSPNKFLKGAMTERLSSWHPTDFLKRGVPSPELIHVYRRWGQGGTGLLLTGNVMIDYDQLEAPGNAIIPPGAEFSGERFEAFKELATESKKEGSLILAQVSHPGRQVEARVQKDPVSASDVKLTKSLFGAAIEFAKPHAATKQEIGQIVDSFAHAAEYLDKAGYDGIELHGAHGYLLAQFLSLTTNKRTDEYGGSITNRARIITEIASKIRARTSPSFILGIKLNSVEFQESGFQPEEAREVVKLLEQYRYDFVELSGGTYEDFRMSVADMKESTRKRESFFIEFADLIAPAAKEIKVYVTGGFRTVGAMVEALNTIDGIGLGRPLCGEPNLVKDILAGRVSGVIQPALADADLALSITLGGVHIKQISKDHQPFDASDPENIEGFKKDVQASMAKMIADTGLEFVHSTDLVSVKTIPYGGAAEGVVSQAV